MSKGEFSITLNETDYRIIQDALQKLSVIEQDAVVGKGLKEGATIIVNEGKRNLQSRNNSKTGNLLRSFSTNLKKKRGKINAGFKRGTKKSIGGGNHSHLIDRGTDERFTKKGYYRGSVSKGNPNKGSLFWTDAFNTKKNEAGNELIDSIKISIQRIISRRK